MAPLLLCFARLAATLLRTLLFLIARRSRTVLTRPACTTKLRSMGELLARAGTCVGLLPSPLVACTSRAPSRRPLAASQPDRHAHRVLLRPLQREARLLLHQGDTRTSIAPDPLAHTSDPSRGRILRIACKPRGVYARPLLGWARVRRIAPRPSISCGRVCRHGRSRGPWSAPVGDPHGFQQPAVALSRVYPLRMHLHLPSLNEDGRPRSFKPRPTLLPKVAALSTTRALAPVHEAVRGSASGCHR